MGVYGNTEIPKKLLPVQHIIDINNLKQLDSTNLFTTLLDKPTLSQRYLWKPIDNGGRKGKI